MERAVVADTSRRAEMEAMSLGLAEVVDQVD